MFKFRKTHLSQTVVRAEDLKVGDVIQYDPYSCAKVENISSLNERDVRVRVERIPLAGIHGDIVSMDLCKEMNLFTWK